MKDFFSSRPHPYTASLIIVSIALIITLGAVSRLAIFYKNTNPESRAYSTDPLLTNLDGYYYLSQASDLLSGRYTQEDTKRRTPDHPPRTTATPLLAGSVALVSKILGLTPNQVSLYLPVFFGVLLAAPVFLIGTAHFSLKHNLILSLLSISPLYYFYRTSPGWIDTDILNVTFCYISIWLGLLANRSPWPTVALIASASIAVAYLFISWWDQVWLVPATLALSPLIFLLGARIFRENRSNRGAVWLFLICLTAIAAVLVLLGTNLAKQILSIALYVMEGQDGIFPNLSQSITEQGSFDLFRFAHFNSGNVATLTLALGGLVIFFQRNPILLLGFAPQIVLFVVAALTAIRFSLFTAPLIALGLTQCLQSLDDWLSNKAYKNILSNSLLVFIGGSLLVPLWGAGFRFYPDPRIMDGLIAIEAETEPEAVIWSWWDDGYPIQYWSQRPTISDGQFHDGQLSILNALPLLSGSEAFAANFMRFYVTHGRAGIAKVMGWFGGNWDETREFLQFTLGDSSLPPHPDLRLRFDGKIPYSDVELQRFLFPRTRRPIYLFLNIGTAYTAYWWSWFAAWDSASKSSTHSVFRAYWNVARSGETLVGEDGLTVDIRNKILIEKGSAIKVKAIIVRDGKRPPVVYKSSFGDLIFEANLESGVASLSSDAFHQSVFHSLYISESPKTANFVPIKLNTPNYQLWRVAPNVDW